MNKLKLISILFLFLFTYTFTFCNQSSFFKEISFKDADFTTLKYADFDILQINPRIISILKDSTTFNNQDFKMGLYNDNKDNALVITERFSSNIISSIKIGTTVKDIKTQLGNNYETIETNNKSIPIYIYYKSKDISVLFYINNKNTLAKAVLGFTPKDLTYHKTILKDILNAVSDDSVIYSDFVNSNKELSNLFQDFHIHGGGQGLVSEIGIEATSLDTVDVTVYRNFKGILYSIPNDKINLSYINKDFYQISLENAMFQYDFICESIQSNGIVSPSGKYTFCYIFEYSMCYYSFIRKNDFSEIDNYINLGRIGNYFWLTDNLILYDGDIESKCLIFDVKKNKDILNVAEFISKNCNLQVNDCQFTINSVGKNYFLVEDSNSDKIYKILYTINNNQTISLKLAPEKEDKIITDIVNWNHPTKQIFIKNNIILSKVILTRDNKYPIFYVKSISKSFDESSLFLKELAEKNGYWDFKVTDNIHSIEVSCDKNKHSITSVYSDFK